MGEIWLIYNPRSQTADDAVAAEVEALFLEAGRPIGRKLVVGEERLPDGDTERMASVDMIVVLSGDGTVSAVAKGLRDWQGTLLVLPGGTMNLLAKALHGDKSAAEIASAALAGAGSIGPVPVICTGEETAYTGIIVGPSSAWADVREDMRNLDLKAIGPDAVQAIQATFSEPRAGIEGSDATFPAIYLEPSADGLSAFGVLAEGARDLIAHGWAWLKGDFRDGPGEALPIGETVTLASSADSFDMLVDGERAEAPNPATFTRAMSTVRFFSMHGEARWS